MSQIFYWVTVFSYCEQTLPIMFNMYLPVSSYFHVTYISQKIIISKRKERRGNWCPALDQSYASDCTTQWPSCESVVLIKMPWNWAKAFFLMSIFNLSGCDWHLTRSGSFYGGTWLYQVVVCCYFDSRIVSALQLRFSILYCISAFIFHMNTIPSFMPTVKILVFVLVQGFDLMAVFSIIN